MNKRQREKHDDDVLLEADAIGDAAARFAEFKSAHEKRIDALILHYSDEEAERLLSVLRESFWSASS